MDSVRKKRSNDGVSVARQKDLEAQLATLRDQEAVLLRTIELLQARGSAPANTLLQHAGATPVLAANARPTAELKDYDAKVQQVTEDRKRRLRALWTDLRKVVNALRSNKQSQAIFGTPVRETQWGGVAANWDKYTSVVREPMDLRTIKESLGDDESTRKYQSPLEARDHINLMTANCISYNTGQEGEYVRRCAESLQQTFAKKWEDGGFEQKWQQEQARQRVENQELNDLKVAAQGSTVDKIRYFDNCVRRRLQDLHTAEPSPSQPFTWEQKRKLSLACSNLGEKDCYAVVEIIANSGDVDVSGEGEVTVDIESLPDSVLHKIQKFVASAPAVARPAADAAASESPRVADAAAAGQDAAPQGDAAVADGSRPNGHAAPASPSQAQAGAADVDGDSGSSSSSASSSSSDDDDGGGSDKSSHSAGKSSNSADSKQGESNHGKAAKGKDDSPRKYTSGDGGDTVLMSRNVPADDGKPAPAILKVDDDREIKVENEDDWVVPADEPEQAAEPAGVEEAPKDPLWEETARQAEQLNERNRIEREKREEQEQERQQRELDKRKTEEEAANAVEQERVEREQKRKKELEAANREPGESDDEEIVVGV